MAEHRAIIRWTQSSGDFAKGRYSREHTWTFDGGLTVPASSAPAVVPPPLSNPANVDPEEAFVAAIASCHMLTFLYVAQRQGFVIASYEDEAVGTMGKDAAGVPWVSSVLLSPRIHYANDKRPTAEESSKLHDAAHHGCFIANSVKTEILVRPTNED